MNNPRQPARTKKTRQKKTKCALQSASINKLFEHFETVDEFAADVLKEFRVVQDRQATEILRTNPLSAADEYEQELDQILTGIEK